MSIVPKETVEVIAQSIGINSLSPDAALALAPDVEYRMREIMQEGIKCMHHSKRTTLTTDDIDSALSMRNVEPLYGFASGDPLRFKRALGHKDLFYLDDKEVDFKEVIEAPLPKAPLDTSLFCHWLAIEGVQPAIPENAPIEVIASLPETKKPEQKSDELPVDIRLPVKHVLSRELQLYFNKITELAVSMPDSILFKEALSSLATDSGLHPLVPYFTCFIEDEVSRGLNDFQLLFALMRLVSSLLQNPHIHVEPYLHQLMPPVVTCILARKLGKRIADNHWELRDLAANLVAHICKRFGHNYTSLQTRLTTTLLKPFLDPKRSLPQHYGAVQGLAALGPHVVRLRILPNLETNLGILEEILCDNEKKEMTRHEAWRVYGALLRAAGRSIYDLLKLFPVLPSPTANSVWKANSRVIGTSETHKRKASSEELEQQPSPKKMMTDGPVVSPSSNNDMAIAAQGETAAAAGETAADAGETAADAGETAANNDMVIDVQPETAANSGETTANAGKPEPETSSAHKQMSDNGGAKDTNGKREKGNSSRHALRTPAYLEQVWKDDLNSGQLVISLFELFGEGIMSFIPAPEMSLFL